MKDKLAFYRWLQKRRERADPIGYLAQDVERESFWHNRVPRPTLGHLGDFPLWEKYLPRGRYDPHRTPLNAYWEYFYSE